MRRSGPVATCSSTPPSITVPCRGHVRGWWRRRHQDRRHERQDPVRDHRGHRDPGDARRRSLHPPGRRLEGRRVDYSKTWSRGRGWRTSDTPDNPDPGVTITGLTETIVRGGARITARTVDIVALVSKMAAKAEAYAEGYSATLVTQADAFALASVSIDSDTLVSILGDVAHPTTITGLQGVDLEARHEGTSITRTAKRLSIAVTFPQSSYATGNDSLQNKIQADEHVHVIAGGRAATPTRHPGCGPPAIRSPCSSSRSTRRATGPWPTSRRGSPTTSTKTSSTITNPRVIVAVWSSGMRTSRSSAEVAERLARGRRHGPCRRGERHPINGALATVGQASGATTP